MLTFHHTCIGHSHLQSSKPCQDASLSSTFGDFHLSIISDGHGGSHYTRSDIGSRLAVETTERVIRMMFAQPFYLPYHYDLRPSTLRDLPLITENRDLFTDNVHLLPQEVHSALFELQDAIIGQWREAVRQHAEQNPLTEQETSYASCRDNLTGERKRIVERLYGCTLMFALYSPDFWLVMQIGDGRCVAFRQLQKEPVFEPLPLDVHCFLNKTTSLCDSSAIFFFHYCLGGQSTLPFAILLGTDGIENSWGTDEKLYNFYIDLLKQAASSSREELLSDLASALPMLSRVGSQDDMSIAGIVNTEVLCQQVPALLTYQIDQRRAQLEDLEQHCAELQEKIRSLQEYFDSIDIERLMRDLQNLQSDLAQRTEERHRIEQKLALLLSQRP